MYLNVIAALRESPEWQDVYCQYRTHHPYGDDGSADDQGDKTKYKGER